MSSPTEPHWSQTEAFGRYLADLVAGELARLRPGWNGGASRHDPGLALGDGGLALDSLERLRVLEALAEALDLVTLGGPDPAPEILTLADLEAEARHSLPSSGGTLGFLTSGSTGRPKKVRHAWADLDREIDVLADLTGPVRRVLAVVPAAPIYGFLFTVLLPSRLQIPVLDLRGDVPSHILSLAQAGDLIVATPPTWITLSSRSAWPRGVTGVTSGAPCPAPVACSLRETGLRLLEIYGSTETGGIGWRDDERSPFRLFPTWSREGDDRISRARSPEQSVDLPDHVVWEGADLLRPVGRRDGAVQVAGVNVWPERVASVLRAHPGVAEARVRLMRPEEGDWLKAFVVPCGVQDQDDLRRELDTWSRARLSPPERPRAITFGAALPVTRSGKPGDWFLDDA